MFFRNARRKSVPKEKRSSGESPSTSRKESACTSKKAKIDTTSTQRNLDLKDPIDLKNSLFDRLQSCDLKNLYSQRQSRFWFMLQGQFWQKALTTKIADLLHSQF